MLTELEPLLAARLSRFPAVAAAYLFGSILDSEIANDIDVGLVVSPSPGSRSHNDERQAMHLESDVAASLGTFRGKRFDVSVLSSRDVFFSMSVVRRGHLVYVATPDILTDFIEDVSRRYADLYPRYRQALDEALEAVRR